MLTCADIHAPNLNVQNAKFRLLLHRECERRFPFVIRNFAPRAIPWFIRFRNFLKSLWKKIFGFWVLSKG